MFGYKVSCDKNKIIVNAKNGEENINTTFDKNKTYFDNKFTYFAFEKDDNGVIHVYEDVNGTYVYGDAISYISTDGPVYYFGRDSKIIDNHIYAALPRASTSEDNIGKIIDFSINGNIYSFIRQAQNTVYVEIIKSIIIYVSTNSTKSRSIKYI